MVRTLGLHCCGLCLIPDQGTEILQTAWCGQKNNSILYNNCCFHEEVEGNVMPR